jgi:hypothetical protein
LHWALRGAAAANGAMAKLHAVAVVHTRGDRDAFPEKMAIQAQFSALSGNFRASYQVTRSLSGFVPGQLESVKMLDGTMSSSEAQRQERWQERFASLYSGEIAGSIGDTASSPAAMAANSTFKLVSEDSEKAIG